MSCDIKLYYMLNHITHGLVLYYNICIMLYGIVFHCFIMCYIN